MTAQALFASILALAVTLAGMRLAFQYRAARNAALRVAVLWLLMALSAAALYFTAFPLPLRVPAQTLVVMTANADQVKNIPAGIRIALPEAAGEMNAQRMPDLASALRRYPGVESLVVVGDGLPARDRDAVQMKPLRLLPAAAPVGIITLWQQPVITAGSVWRVQGRVLGMQNARVELLDPAGKSVRMAAVDAKGGFVLEDTARTAGRADYRVRLIASDKRVVEDIPLLLDGVDPPIVRVLVRASGPGPELKQLRRWALDAGVSLQSRVDLGPDMFLQSGTPTLTAAALQAQDLLILDERAWAELSAAERQAVRLAVQGGLGLLLRINGPLPPQTITDWKTFGFAIRESDGPQTVRLDLPGASDAWPDFTRRTLRINANDAKSLLQTAQGDALGLWRPVGEGRVGVLWLLDSYRLVLAGFSLQHSQFWSRTASVLARSQPTADPQWRDGVAWLGERTVFCHLAETPRMITEGNAIPLIRESVGLNSGCAAFWPKTTGVHTLETAGQRMRFLVRSPQQAKAMYRYRIQQETRQLAERQRGITAMNEQTVEAPGSPWPAFIVWLILSAALWWLERNKRVLARNGV